MDRSTEPTPSDAEQTHRSTDSSAGGRHQATAPARRRRLLALLVGLTVVVLVVDQATKYLAVTRLEPGEYVPVIGDFLGLSLVFNSGAAFSFAEGSTWIFTIAATVVTTVIIVVARRLGSLAWAIALGALLGGNLGNLADRLFREPGFGKGHVVDMINYNNWFVGNVADIAIVLSAIGIAVLTFRGLGVDGRRLAPAGPDAEATTDDEASSAVEPEGTGPDRDPTTDEEASTAVEPGDGATTADGSDRG
ncbi:signal peptidase II [Occultella glacieicola]|uniref:Lipoprotein signal peptidase n=1 Tax=Occultella glacieicola TaxID=2518684 RepID=A0ABY2E096_9MICO|nr:signal peptidase II [Occultella glacieicola]TDE90828.1 signal peptidase II [Occultella glacieicola]